VREKDKLFFKALVGIEGVWKWIHWFRFNKSRKNWGCECECEGSVAL